MLLGLSVHPLDRDGSPFHESMPGGTGSITDVGFDACCLLAVTEDAVSSSDQDIGLVEPCGCRSPCLTSIKSDEELYNGYNIRCQCQPAYLLGAQKENRALGGKGGGQGNKQ